MPLYDLRCPRCGEIFLDVFIKVANLEDTLAGQCPGCGQIEKLELMVPAPANEDWSHGGEGRYFEHLSHAGKTFHSKGRYREFLKRHALTEKD